MSSFMSLSLADSCPLPSPPPEYRGREYEGHRLRYRSPPLFALDERFRAGAGLGVGVLCWGRLHEIAGGAEQRPADAAVQRELGAADGVDHDACAVGRVPH